MLLLLFQWAAQRAISDSLDGNSVSVIVTTWLEEMSVISICFMDAAVLEASPSPSRGSESILELLWSDFLLLRTNRKASATMARRPTTHPTMRETSLPGALAGNDVG
jgi:hypothetical protein